jgi:predicted permease
MTVDSRPEHTAPADGPSIHVVRARKLLRGGAVGGLGATALCLVGFTLGYGASGLISAGLAAAMVLFFYGLGQYVMVLFADAGARTLLTVSLCSYTTRVVVLGLVLALYDRYYQAWPTLVPMAIFVTTIAVVAGWLSVEVFVFSRLRIGVYDTEYVPPAGGASAP